MIVNHQSSPDLLRSTRLLYYYSVQPNASMHPCIHATGLDMSRANVLLIDTKLQNYLETLVNKENHHTHINY